MFDGIFEGRLCTPEPAERSYSREFAEMWEDGCDDFKETKDPDYEYDLWAEQQAVEYFNKLDEEKKNEQT